jgi:hypothetical protein
MIKFVSHPKDDPWIVQWLKMNNDQKLPSEAGGNTVNGRDDPNHNWGFNWNKRQHHPMQRKNLCHKETKLLSL